MCKLAIEALCSLLQRHRPSPVPPRRREPRPGCCFRRFHPLAPFLRIHFCVCEVGKCRRHTAILYVKYLSLKKTSQQCLPFGADERCDEEGQAEEAVHPVLEGGFVGAGGGPGRRVAFRAWRRRRRRRVGLVRRRQRPVGGGERRGEDLGCHLFAF